jgi:hypothetical protein
MFIEDRLFLAVASLRKRRLFTGDPLVVQEKLLLNLVKRSVYTVFGKAHDFSSIRTSQEFLERVPPKSYDEFKPYIDTIIGGERDVLFPGRPKCFGVTSGTNGIPKFIPLNRPLLRSTRSGAFDAALLGGLSSGSLSWHRGKTLYIGPRKGQQMGTWIVYAEGTAFAYLQPFRSRFVPSYEILPEQKEDLDFSLFADLARHHRITVIAGNPMEIVAFVLATGTVMPEVKIVFNCGYWALDHKHVYESAFPNATVIDVYGSNEGTYGLPYSAGEFFLNYRRMFFSFLPIEGGDESVSIRQVALHRKYKLCVTTPGGLWNYLTGDIVSFSSFRPPIMRLHGRAQRSLKLNGDWLTEDEVVSAVRKSRIRSLKYFLTREVNRCVLYIDGETADAKLIDHHLCEVNPTYARLRTSGGLDPLTVRQTSIATSMRRKPPRIKRTAHNLHECSQIKTSSSF